jgi:hypothetical protein
MSEMKPNLTAKKMLAAHRRKRKSKAGLTTWYIYTPRRRKIQLQECKGRLYLYGCLYESTKGMPRKLLPFEISYSQIAQQFIVRDQ